jgi:spore maturation protein CgeB
MKIRMFYHSLVSDWNHGHAHFLRGIVAELMFRGHDVVVYEPAAGWSLTNLVLEHGLEPLQEFRRRFPGFKNSCYDPKTFDVEKTLADADLVIVHEWSNPSLVRRIGQCRAHRDFALLFHDPHHRMVTAPESMRSYDLSQYDGVLAFGKVLRDLYLEQRIVQRAWTWHEAADIRVFRPLNGVPRWGDVVWVGNWGDEERTEELQEFLIEPIQALGLKARVHGVRYPDTARAALAKAGIEYAGWLPNYQVPRAFSEFKLTLHIPRRPYARALPGIPTIRPFEALACGMPLICSPWTDAEHLFRAGSDYLVAHDGKEMKRHLAALLANYNWRHALGQNGLATIRARHTCAHRVDELLAIYRHIRSERNATPSRIPTKYRHACAA